MPFKRSTPQQLLERISTEFDLALPGSDARLRRSVENVLSRALVIAENELYGYLTYLAKQIFVDTASVEFLERHAAIWGITRKPAAAASGEVTFTGSNTAVIPAGTVLQLKNGRQFTTDAELVIAGGTATGTVTAALAGQDGNTDASASIALVSPISGIQSAAAIGEDGLTGGADIESDAALAARVIKRIQQPPHGGAKFDYETWALEVPGVTRAWVYPEQMGVGTVSVTFVMDDRDDIIPLAGDVANVQAHIDTARPVTADVSVFAPTPVAVDFEITLNPNNADTRAAVQAEIADFFQREAAPGGTLYWSRMMEAISTATGEFDHVLAQPAANVVMDYGEMPVVGEFTFNDPA